MCGVGTAVAQPGSNEPPPAAPAPYAPAPPPPTGYPPPPAPGYAPPAYGYQPRPPQYVLSPEDNELLQRGDISDGEQVGGGLVAAFVGFGVGQAVQGRWTDTGWMYTLGESASLAALLWGALDVASCPVYTTCNNSSFGGGLLIGGVLAFAGFRVAGVIDAFVGPPRHNARLRELRQRLGIPQPVEYGLAPYIAPSTSGAGGAVGGLSLRF